MNQDALQPRSPHGAFECKDGQCEQYENTDLLIHQQLLQQNERVLGNDGAP